MMAEQKPATDPATTEVIRHYLTSAVTEMERTLVRTAYSTLSLIHISEPTRPY